MQNQLRIPNEQPHFDRVFSVSPLHFFQTGNIAIVEPVLQQLMYADFSQLQNPQFSQQLYQVTQLLQLTLQYFAQAQDSYAEQFEQSTKQNSQLKFQIQQLQNQVNIMHGELHEKKEEKQPTPTFVLQMQAVKEANQMIIRENYQLKQQMKQFVQVVKQKDIPTCKYCNKKFTNNEYLLQHIHRKHKEKFDQFCNQNKEIVNQHEQEIKEHNKVVISQIKPEFNKQASAKQNNVQLAEPNPYQLEQQIDLADFDQIQRNFDELKLMMENAKHESVGEMFQ